MLEQFVAGGIGAPFGVKGHCKVKVFSGDIRKLEALSSVLLRKDGAERKYAVEETGGASSSFFMKFKGVDSPEAAKLLTGWEIIVDRADAAPLGADEYYIADLRGVEVFLLGKKVGDIVDVLEGGGGQLVEIALSGGERRLVPFRSEFFGKVDTAERKAELLEEWILE
ncbi:MAG: 16S rRNA processing protein RimM [Treponema sp. GWB1_62_6]|nr:MAG: 16S rRNA processing protein RimM [Treponema sp. GWA1_62_8]OHE68144.1 MAG: 16S rRNA processing protein RimM [Treponema sp. RIFOXYC1_FULL_61_9]OHE70049.1 MAG: 16S rRNA processing protein RimM [Treponema sp. GWC1_61_84]OHE70962.1 MAG: 16S rRNA processing protein RimM [Treponema sp. GWB1_62_6]HCM25393.1 16S rRNA processing protein RimM [Treponema sp.]